MKESKTLTALRNVRDKNGGIPQIEFPPCKLFTHLFSVQKVHCNFKEISYTFYREKEKQ